MYLRKGFILSLMAILLALPCMAQNKYETRITSADGEKWWGGMVALGSKMPFGGNLRLVDLASENLNNQNVPLFLSSKGRFIWSDKPFFFKTENGQLHIYSEYEKVTPVQAGKTLKEAYRTASSKFFPPSGKMPDPLFFSMPQYNTWIELMYNQNQEDILKYADNVLKNNFPVGVFMVDDNWQKYYGNFDFKPERFADPKGMIDRLHKDGFRIMLWICPFVSPDSPEFRELQNKGYLIKKKGTNEAAIIPWWNGYSACYDLSNPQAVSHLKGNLKNLQEKYGVDGFKFDAGDVSHFNDPTLEFYDKAATSVDMCQYWAKIGLDFPFNEYRAGWKMGGQALVQRLGDKDYSWDAVGLLITDMISAGLLGYAYTCPDMIGGGQFGSFLHIDQTKLDQELIVRSCQVHALMPMMQFSVAPWRILDEKHLAICRSYASLHQKMGDYILEQAHQSAKNGEPIIRHMEYEFPNQGFAECKDQFMLGDRYLVAPVLTKEHTRKVVLPKGLWKDDTGKKFKGPRTIEVDAPLERLPYYERIISL